MRLRCQMWSILINVLGGKEHISRNKGNATLIPKQRPHPVICHASKLGNRAILAHYIIIEFNTCSPHADKLLVGDV